MSGLSHKQVHQRVDGREKRDAAIISDSEASEVDSEQDVFPRVEEAFVFPDTHTEAGARQRTMAGKVPGDERVLEMLALCELEAREAALLSKQALIEVQVQLLGYKINALRVQARE